MPGREYVMFDQRPFVLLEILDDPLTIPVAPEPMMKLDPNYSSGGGGDEGDGKRPRGTCWLCWLGKLAVLVVSAIVLAQIAGIYHFWVP